MRVFDFDFFKPKAFWSLKTLKSSFRIKTRIGRFFLNYNLKKSFRGSSQPIWVDK